MTLWEAFMDLISVMGEYLIGYVVGSIVCFIILRPIKVYHEGFDDGWEASRTVGKNGPDKVVTFCKDSQRNLYQAEITGKRKRTKPAHELTRIFHGPGYTVKALPQSCFFCDHLTDIIYDYTNGPYGFACDLDGDIETGMRGLCQNFSEEENHGTTD